MSKIVKNISLYVLAPVVISVALCVVYMMYNFVFTFTGAPGAQFLAAVAVVFTIVFTMFGLSVMNE